VDDGSTDETREYLYLLAKHWREKKEVNKCGLLVHHHPHCGWPGILRKKGIELSFGRYICYLDDDNKYKSRHIEVLTNYLNSHPDIDIVYGSTEIYNKDGTTYIRDVEFNGEKFYKCNFIDTSDVMHRRSCITPYINWDLGVSNAKTIHEDIELWDQFIKTGYKFAHVKDVLTEYYFHDRQRTDHQNRFRIMASECPAIS
jgi:glycosyltransferase involved in cell wall biosynthesis